MNKFYRVTGTVVAALTLAASAAAFSAPYAAAQPTAHQAAAKPAAGKPVAGKPQPHPMIAAPMPASIAAMPNGISGITKKTSQNWSGYAVTGGKFKRIRATFYVPIMNCHNTPDTFSSHWVGLDGFKSNTVEQDGIEADCNGTTEQVFAWREVFPHPEQPFTTLRIRPGDSITATTTFTHGKFKMKVKDNTTGHSRTVSQRCAGGATCRRNSAEVISEAPTVDNKQSSLADYGAQPYSAISIRNSRGRHGGIRSSHWRAFRIFQVGISTHSLIAAPTALHGPAFAVYWLGEN